MNSLSKSNRFFSTACTPVLNSAPGGAPITTFPSFLAAATNCCHSVPASTASTSFGSGFTRKILAAKNTEIDRFISLPLIYVLRKSSRGAHSAKSKSYRLETERWLDTLRIRYYSAFGVERLPGGSSRQICTGFSCCSSTQGSLFADRQQPFRTAQNAGSLFLACRCDIIHSC